MIDKVCTKIDDIRYPQRIVGIFLVIWFAINLLQSIFTELAHDEAYYWLFSQKLDWGYFDHPPMIALLIKMGYSLFANEFGVRLIPLLMGVCTIWILYLLVADKLSNLSTFLLVASSIVILQSHVGGFLAIPDLPVIFFSALFFLWYRKYLRNDTLYSAAIIGLITAAMLYSKYHGVLVIFFTLISNLKVLKRWTFYIIPVVTTIAMLPHLFWQIDNGFPTFEYHLVSRSSDYRFVYTLNYLLGQLLIAGPLIGIMLFYHAGKASVGKDEFLKAMRFNFIGFFVFFFFMSFKGHVEAHWTAIGFIPAVVLASVNLSKSVNGIRWLRRLFIPGLLMFLMIRLALVVEMVPAKYNIGREFHNWDKWAQEVKKVAKDHKVVFYSTFQRPAKYSFYTNGEFSCSINHVMYRKNQFDLWNYHDSIQGESIVLFRMPKAKDTIYTATSENYTYRYFDNFKSYSDIKIELTGDQELISAPSDSVVIEVKVYNHRTDTLDLNKYDQYSPQYAITFYNGRRHGPISKSRYIENQIPPCDSIKQKLVFKAPTQPGNYTFHVSIVNDNLYPGFNSKSYTLEVRD